MYTIIVPKVERNWHFESTLQLSEMMNKVMHSSYTTPPSLEFQPSLSPGGPSNLDSCFLQDDSEATSVKVRTAS